MAHLFLTAGAGYRRKVEVVFCQFQSQPLVACTCCQEEMGHMQKPEVHTSEPF
jgi:hypothetical protein